MDEVCNIAVEKVLGVNVFLAKVENMIYENYRDIVKDIENLNSVEVTYEDDFDINSNNVFLSKVLVTVRNKELVEDFLRKITNVHVGFGKNIINVIYLYFEKI